MSGAVLAVIFFQYILQRFQYTLHLLVIFSRRRLVDIRRPVHASKRSNEIAFDRTISDAPAKTETNKQTDRHAQSYTNVQKVRDKEKHSSEQTQADRQEGMARCSVATDASVVWLAIRLGGFIIDQAALQRLLQLIAFS